MGKCNKNILVTGSSQGIGLAVAKHLSRNHSVFITGRHKLKLDELCQKNNFAGYIDIDLCHENSAEKLVQNLNKNIDVLINNAGEYFYKGIEDIEHQEMMHSIMLNTIAPLELIKYTVPYMKKNKWGRIINIGSISGVMGEAYASVYSLTKSSLIGMTKSLALEFAQDNITVNVINPGWVDTDLINDENLQKDFSKKEIIETIPQRRFVHPNEIASMCEFLISDSAKTITGQSINICAGLSVGC